MIGMIIMKRIISVFLTVLICLSFSSVVNASTGALTDDGVFKYKVINNEFIRLTGFVSDGELVDEYINADGWFVIPSEIDGKPVKQLGDYLFFYDDVPSEKVIVPDSVVSIGNCAFYSDTEIDGRSKLSSIKLPRNLLSIGNNVFTGTSIKSIDIPKSVVSIGDWFCSDSLLKSVVVPDNVLKLGDCAFENCSYLRSAVLPSTMSQIPREAFFNCKLLNSVTMSDAVERVYPGAFYGCDSLKSLRLPEDVLLYGSSNKRFGYTYKGKVSGFKLNVLYTEKDKFNSRLSTLSNLFSVNYYLPKSEKLLRAGKLNCGSKINLKVNDSKITNFKSGDSQVLTVTKTGTVSALKKGKTDVTITLADGKTVKCRFKIANNPSLSFSTKTSGLLSVKVGKSARVTINGKLKGCSNVYKSTSYAKITGKKSSAFFNVKGLKKGKTALKIKVNGMWLKLNVKVV